MITLAQFESLERGMDYEEVCAVLGGGGELISSESAQIEPGIAVLSVQTDLYEWRNENDSWIRLMFNQHQLSDTAQEGLV
jgi:hypothetical protein